MKKWFVFLVIMGMVVNISFAETKNADLAGSWYPASKDALESMLNGFLEKADPEKVNGKIIALISPHAGYRFSGQVAAFGFKLIQGKPIKTVIVVGFNHRIPHSGIAVCDYDSYKTPLGKVEIDKNLSQELIAESDGIYSMKKVFHNENSTEMQIPFLQMVLSGFKIVIIQMGDQGLENCRILSDALYETLKQRKDFILIGSADMSHFLPYERANKIDAYTAAELEKFEPESFYEKSALNKHALMCGYGAVCATMMVCKRLGADKIDVLNMANSGDITFDRRSVVGYLSAAIVKSRDTMNDGRWMRDEKSKTKRGDRGMLNKEQKEKMLKMARDSIVYYLKNRKKLPVKESDPVLNKEMGAFVTLHEHGRLRGCIGNIIGRGPFYLTVRDMAVEAATGDPRFRPVTFNEMDDIDIEISVLSPLEKIADPENIEPGKHGVLVKNAFRSGVYLPQVVTEVGWTREEFMNSLCGQKAGMAPDAWKKGECEIYVFTAEVFGEKK